MFIFLPRLVHSCLFFYENDGIRSHYFLRGSIALSSQLASPKSKPQHQCSDLFFLGGGYNNFQLMSKKISSKQTVDCLLKREPERSLKHAERCLLIKCWFGLRITGVPPRIYGFLEAVSSPSTYPCQ